MVFIETLLLALLKLQQKLFIATLQHGDYVVFVLEISVQLLQVFS